MSIGTQAMSLTELSTSFEDVSVLEVSIAFGLFCINQIIINIIADVWRHLRGQNRPHDQATERILEMTVRADRDRELMNHIVTQRNARTEEVWALRRILKENGINYIYDPDASPISPEERTD